MKPLKTNALEWINSLYEKYPLDQKEKVLMDYPFYFKLEGFADEPEVYLRTKNDGLEFGYEATQWDGYMPSPIPGVYKKHSLPWETLQSLNKEKQQEMILELLMKTINTRKRQYRKCQFCSEKVAIPLPKSPSPPSSPSHSPQTLTALYPIPLISPFFFIPLCYIVLPQNARK